MIVSLKKVRLHILFEYTFVASKVNHLEKNCPYEGGKDFEDLDRNC